MALSQDDKKDIAKLISEEIARQLTQAGTIATPNVEIRHVGIPIDMASFGLAQRPAVPPVAADQCCNGCD